MKTFKIFIITLFLLCTGIAHAQVPPQNYVPVQGQVIDPSSTTWGYGGITFKYYNPSSTQPPVWTATGVPLQPSELTLTTQLDQNGDFEISNVPDNAAISPAGSGWQLTICPTASTPCQVSPNAVTVTGNSTVDVSSFIASFIQTPVIAPGTITLAYNQSEINNPPVGAAYIDMNPNDAAFLSMYSWDGFEWNQIVNSQGGTPASCNSLNPDVSHYICNNVGNQVINPGNLQLQDNNQAWLELGGFANGPPGSDSNLYIWEGGVFGSYLGQAHFDNDYGINPSNVGDSYFTNTYGSFYFTMGNLGTVETIDKITGQATFAFQLNAPTLNGTTEIETPKIVLNGGTPITSQSSAQPQVVTVQTGGSGTQYPGADGAWHTPATPYTPPAFTGTSGYQILSSGLILEWVNGPTESANYSGNQIVTFPLTFPHAVLSVQASMQTPTSPSGNGSAYAAYIQSFTTGQVTVYYDVGPDSVGTVSHNAVIFAIGY